MISVEAFNEPDYGWGQGSIQNLNDILGTLQTTPDFAGVGLGGPSTLSDGAARNWYEPLKSRLQIGTTHSLGGSFDDYVNFYRQVTADGKMRENPEAHNLVEVIAGAEYGLQSAIWWGTAELARGEFVKAVQGERLAYAEDRPRWSAAGVYRAPGGKIQAFVGASERMGETTTYRLVSEDRPVFFNGDGPRRAFDVQVRQNGEFLVNVTWGADIPPKIGGRCVLVNRRTGKVLEVADADKTDGADIRLANYKSAANQQWNIAPFVGPYGDQSYFTLRAVHSGKALDTANHNFDEGGRIQQWGAGDGDAQHWYFEYAGDNNFYIRSRWSTKCLGVADDGSRIGQFSRTDDSRLQWRLVPVSALTGPPDFVAPKSPTGLTASVKSSVVELDWTASRASDLLGYAVFRSVTPDGPYDTIARQVTGTRFVDKDAAPHRVYFYKIKAVDRSLNSSAFSARARVSR